MLNNSLRNHQHLLSGVKMLHLKVDKVKLIGFRFFCHSRKCLLFAQTNIIILIMCCRLVRLSLLGKHDSVRASASYMKAG